MPSQMIAPLVLMIILVIVAIVLSTISIKNVKQHISHSLYNHQIEIITSFTFAKLVVDNKVIDEIHSWQMHTVKLQGSVEDKQILVNIGTGFLKPKIITFIDQEKINELSNC